jgi:hypothetical protein
MAKKWPRRVPTVARFGRLCDAHVLNRPSGVVRLGLATNRRLLVTGREVKMRAA